MQSSWSIPYRYIFTRINIIFIVISIGINLVPSIINVIILMILIILTIMIMIIVLIFLILCHICFVLSLSLAAYGFVTLCHATRHPYWAIKASSQPLPCQRTMSNAAICVILNMPLGLVDVSGRIFRLPGVVSDFSIFFHVLEVCCWCGLQVYFLHMYTLLVLHVFCLWTVHPIPIWIFVSHDNLCMPRIHIPYEWWRCRTIWKSCLIKECIDWFIHPKQACHRQWFFDPRLFFQQNWTLYQLPSNNTCNMKFPMHNLGK